MSNQLFDKEYEELVKISTKLHEQYVDEDSMWINSPFGWIKQRPSRTIGAIGEKLVDAWLTEHGFNVTHSPNSNADRIVNGKKLEIKFSTLWKTGTYTFQQIRDQDYDFVIMLGISPHSVHCWVLEKEVIMKLWKEDHVISSQHGGKQGADTAWVELSPQNDNKAFAPYGVTLQDALASVSRITGVKYK